MASCDSSLRRGRQQDRQRWSERALGASRVDDRNKASNDRSKPRRELWEANALIRRRGRGVLEFGISMFTLALIRSQREGNKIPRRIPENAKDRGSISRPFSNLFNVACKPVGSNHHDAIFTIGAPESQGFRNAGDAMSSLPAFSSGMKKEDGTAGMSRRSRPRAGGAAREDSGPREERVARSATRSLPIWGQSHAACKREKLEVRSSGSWERWTASVLCPVVRASGRERRGTAVHAPMICINSAAHSMG